MSNEQEASDQKVDLHRTPLYGLHQELQGRMVPFAGWEMPIQFGGEHGGVMAEHTWCRTSAGLFDVSHMAVIELRSENPGADLERVTPAGITTLKPGRQRYGLLLNDDGGVVDDFMVTNWGTHLTMVANASRRDADLAYLAERLPNVEITERPELALLALQGPKAAEALATLSDDPAAIASMVFLDNKELTIDGIDVAAARSGYTGEDGFEITVPNEHAERLARRLLESPLVQPVGLGARDTLRLEAGLCLYGNDLDATISPVEADLVWSMPKRRREAGDFPGGERVKAELANGPTRVRVGLQPEGKRPVRDGATLRLAADDSAAGVVSSGGFGPSVDRPVAMAFVPPAVAEIGTALVADVRGKDVACTVAELPFSPHRFHRGQ